MAELSFSEDLDFIVCHDTAIVKLCKRTHLLCNLHHNEQDMSVRGYRDTITENFGKFWIHMIEQ